MPLFVRRIVWSNGKILNAYEGEIEGADLPPSGVVAGTYPNATVTVDEFGRVTAAEAGVSSNLYDALVSLVWGAPGAEAGDAIEVSASLTDFAGDPLATDQVDVEVRVTDAANDAEPSATATLAAAGTPLGTVLAGTGTATLVVRTTAGGTLGVRVSEAAAAMRYLWVRQAGHAQRFVRARDGVLELAFT